jgi:hypothetical protein
MKVVVEIRKEGNKEKEESEREREKNTEYLCFVSFICRITWI